jgi:hypothetical protein
MILSNDIILGMLLYISLILVVCTGILSILLLTMPKEIPLGIVFVGCLYGFYVINIPNETKVGIILFWVSTECARSLVNNH